MKKNKNAIHNISLYTEAVSPRMKKECEMCKEIPTKKRLVLKKGAGRWIKTLIYCEVCGPRALNILRKKLRFMREELSGIS